MAKDVAKVDIRYELDKVKILSDKPIVLATQTLTNESSTSQQMTFSVSRSTTKTSSFTHSTTVSIEIGATFKAGVPFFAEGEWSVTAGLSETLTWGEETSETKEWSADFPVSVDPTSVVEAIARIDESKAEIPYAMTIYYVDGHKETTSGVYTGVDQAHLKHDISRDLKLEVTDDEDRKHKIGLNLEYHCPKDGENVITQHDFHDNNGVGAFEAGKCIIGNKCPKCRSVLDPNDFKTFWFNQCGVSYNGVSSETNQPVKGTEDFEAKPAIIAALDPSQLYFLNLILKYNFD